MTTDNETFSETLSDEELAAQIDGDDALDSAAPESVEDSIINAINELEGNEAKADEGVQGDEGKEPEIDASKAASILAKSKGQKGGKRQVVEGKDLEQPGQQVAPVDDGFHAPQAWDSEAKAEFQKLPPVAKKEALAFWKRLDAHFTNGSQELARHRQKYGSLEEVEQYYKPHLDQHGLNFAEGTRQLWGSHYEIANPQTKLQGLDKVLRANGVTPEQLYQYRQGMGGQAPQQQFQQAPAQNPLTPETIRSIIGQELQQVHQQQAVRGDAEELQQLRNQVGPDGRALYPELWDNQNLQSNYWNVGYLQRVQPLVEYERKNHPGISVTEATKRAVQLLRLRDGQFSGQAAQAGIPSPTLPRLPNDQETIAKARAANVSIRGRGNGAISNTTAARDGESVEQSLHRAIAELSNGRH